MMTVETVTIEVEANTENARRSFDALNAVARNFGRQVTGALTDAVVKGEDLDDVFRSLAGSLANSALTAGLRPLQDILSNGLNGLLSSLGGRGGRGGAGGGGFLAAFGNALPFARGGVVAAPSFFPLNGGLGVAGEAGPEAILPLRRDATGRLGVAMTGAGSGGANITVNISTPDVAGFRQSEAQVASALARALQRARRTL